MEALWEPEMDQCGGRRLPTARPEGWLTRWRGARPKFELSTKSGRLASFSPAFLDLCCQSVTFLAENADGIMVVMPCGN